MSTGEMQWRDPSAGALSTVWWEKMVTKDIHGSNEDVVQVIDMVKWVIYQRSDHEKLWSNKHIAKEVPGSRFDWAIGGSGQMGCGKG